MTVDTYAVGRCSRCGHMNAIDGDRQIVTCADIACTALVLCDEVRMLMSVKWPTPTITGDRIAEVA